jgi:hypothetical protein
MVFFKKNLKDSLLQKRSITRLHPRTLLWMGGALLCILLKEIIPGQFWDRWFYQGFFLLFRQTYDLLLGWSPLPMVYIIFSVIVVRTARWAGRWEKGWIYQVSHAIGGISAMVTLFYLTWGFNYGQISLQDRLDFHFEKVTQEEIVMEFVRATEVLKNEAAGLPENMRGDESITTAPIDDHMLRPDVERALSDLHMPSGGRVRVRQLWPKGLLLRLNTAGIYIPQTGEGHVDKGLLSVQKPFTIAHEMAHGYGVADEGACNFIAWLACSQSRDQWVRYGGAFTYWRYVAAEMPSDSVLKMMNTLPPVVTRSIALIKANDKRYPDFMPRARDAIYSSYLKRHGVKGGLRSYNEVVMMVTQYLDQSSEHIRPD